jgi:AsmA protein
MRVLKYFIVVLVALCAAAVLVVVVGIPSDFLVEKIRTQFAKETGRQIKIAGGAELHLWPALTVEVKDITLVNDGDPATQTQVTVGSARAEVVLSSLLSGEPKVTQFALVHPVIKVPLLRRAVEAKAGGGDDKPGTAEAPAPARKIPDVGRVVVKDASVIFVRSGDQVESRVDHIDMTATLSEPDHHIDAKIDAKAGKQDLHIQIKSKGPIEQRGKPLPLELTLQAPGFLDDTLSSTASVTSIGSLIKINDLEGKIGPHRFIGWASVDLKSKPKVKLDLDFKRLSLAAAAPETDTAADARPSTFGQAWSDQKIDLDGLNYVDAQVAFSATEFIASSLRIAPLYIEGALANGVLNLGFSNIGLYEGKADGVVTLDVSKDVQKQSMSANLKEVRALPLLSALADFRELDGKMSGQIDVRASGPSERAMMKSLDGFVDVRFQDGQIRGINVADMMRTLTKTTLNGWEKKKAEKTDLSEMSVLFRIDHGVAKTDNFKLAGPLVRVNGAGTADIGEQTLNFKLDSKMVTSLEGQGGPTNPTGFGVPIMVEGKWEAPKIYPDMAGILDNPTAAYSKLNELGAGLFGNTKGGAGSLFQGLGNIFKGGSSTNTDDSKDKKDSQEPAIQEKSSPPPSTQSQSSQTPAAKSQETQAQDTKAQDTKTQDAKTKDTKDQDDDDKKTRDKIKNILNDLFGK